MSNVEVKARNGNFFDIRHLTFNIRYFLFYNSYLSRPINLFDLESPTYLVCKSYCIAFSFYAPAPLPNRWSIQRRMPIHTMIMNSPYRCTPLIIQDLVL